eukprot:3063263-Prorocentrum_lima.AAC.1
MVFEEERTLELVAEPEVNGELHEPRRLLQQGREEELQQEELVSVSELRFKELSSEVVQAETSAMDQAQGSCRTWHQAAIAES